MAGNARRANIPLYRQTDAKFFPDYEYREYPKMMTDQDGDPIMQNPIYQMTTPRDPEAAPRQVMREVMRDGKPFPKPVVIGGDPVIVNNKEEEDNFLKIHPEAAKIVKVDVDDTERLEADNDRMRALLAENEKLRSQLEQPVQQKRKPGRPPKVVAPDLPADLT